MYYKFKFTIIIAVYNVEKYIQETIDSVINQSLSFEENIQIILVNDGSDDNSLDIIKEYEKKYPNNIIVLSKKNGGQASARNEGLKYLEGKYVNFLDGDDYLSQNTLEKVYEFFEDNYDEIDVVAIPMRLFGRVNMPHRLNKKFKETRIINLFIEPNTPQLSASSAFIKSETMKNYRFNMNLVNLEDALLINEIFFEKYKYGVLSDVDYFYRQRLTENSTVDNMTQKKEYYTSRLTNFYIELANFSLKKSGSIPKFIQYLFAYDLQWLLKQNSLDILENEKEKNIFWNKLNQVVDFIDLDIIINNEYIDEHIVPFFVYLKNHENTDILKENDSILLKSDNYILENLSTNVLWLDIVELRNNSLNISGNLKSLFNKKHISINIIKKTSNNDLTKYNSTPVEYNNSKRQNIKYLSIDWKYNYDFDFKIPIKLNDVLTFKIEYDDENLHFSTCPHISFRENCGLSTSNAFFVKDSKIVLFKNNKINVLPYSFKSMLRYEISNIRRICFDKETNYKYAIFIHALYFLLYPILKNKKIWLFSDRPDFADDNAKHLFNYASQIDDNIKKYYILNKASSDYKDMKKINKNIIPFGSLKHKILFLFAQKVISSFVNENFINPFYYKTPSLYSGLITSYRYFLQHGVTKDDVSEFIKKYDKNLSLIVTVSKLEKESFLEKGYNFDKNVVQVLGFPRFDNLISDDKKRQILFAPTWRIELNNESRFLQSTYYSTINSFFNNHDLKKLYETKNYSIIFKPHPELEKYIHLFDIPSYIKISENESYQDLFKNSSILITDYSSVFFDFAYLKKPVIYYQPNDDYHYKKGYFNYEELGFGEIISKEKDLFNEINHLVKNDCKMNQKYVQRVNSFFKYNDKNNCKRVYEWIYSNN